MNDPQKSRLIVVAGPNGSGKTTIAEKLSRHEWMGDCEYIIQMYSYSKSLETGLKELPHFK